MSTAPIQWLPTPCVNGPCLQDHAGCIIGDYFYVHGGLSATRTSTKLASNGLFRIQISPATGQWEDLTTVDSPTLSQHVILGYLDRYLILIGGWTGRERIPGVHTYDLHSFKWLPAATSEPLLRGFPSGAGLSAHTAVHMEPQSGSANKGAAIIICREGSLRTQRKAGNIYLLYCNFPSNINGTPHYAYCEANDILTTSSRSYHTSTPVGPHKLVTIGGRKDRAVESLSWRQAKDTSTVMDWPGKLIFPPSRCKLVTEVIDQVRKQNINTRRLSSTQSCWRGHTTVPVDGGLLVTGGEGFNALVRDPLNDAYVLSYEDNQHALQNIGKITHPRAYGVCAVHAGDGSAWLHGGVGPNGYMQNTLLQLHRSSDISGDQGTH